MDDELDLMNVAPHGGWLISVDSAKRKAQEFVKKEHNGLDFSNVTGITQFWARAFFDELEELGRERNVMCVGCKREVKEALRKVFCEDQTSS